MTDEERKRICEDLRNIEYDKFPQRMRQDIREVAANEIERLAKENAKAITLCGDMLQGQYRLEKAALADRNAK